MAQLGVAQSMEVENLGSGEKDGVNGGAALKRRRPPSAGRRNSVDRTFEDIVGDSNVTITPDQEKAINQRLPLLKDGSKTEKNRRRKQRSRLKKRLLLEAVEQLKAQKEREGRKRLCQRPEAQVSGKPYEKEPTPAPSPAPSNEEEAYFVASLQRPPPPSQRFRRIALWCMLSYSPCCASLSRSRRPAGFYARYRSLRSRGLTHEEASMELSSGSDMDTTEPGAATPADRVASSSGGSTSTNTRNAYSNGYVKCK